MFSVHLSHNISIICASQGCFHAGSNWSVHQCVHHLLTSRSLFGAKIIGWLISHQQEDIYSAHILLLIFFCCCYISSKKVRHAVFTASPMWGFPSLSFFKYFVFIDSPSQMITQYTQEKQNIDVKTWIAPSPQTSFSPSIPYSVAHSLLLFLTCKHCQFLPFLSTLFLLSSLSCKLTVHYHRFHP